MKSVNIKKMKTQIVGNLAAEPQRSLLVGTFQQHEVKSFASGSVVEVYSLLVGKRVLDVSIFAPKGTKPESIKSPPVGFVIGGKAVAVDASVDTNEYGLQARAKSVSFIET